MSDFGELTYDQIEAILHREFIARIGCQSAERPYIVPVTYVYDGKYAYGYSVDGLKLQLMRAHPWVCFQTDRVEARGAWQSVIAYGRFEALADEAAYAALTRLSERLRIVSASEPHVPEVGQSFVTRRHSYGVAYRLELVEKTGRYERPIT